MTEALFSRAEWQLEHCECVLLSDGLLAEAFQDIIKLDWTLVLQGPPKGEWRVRSLSDVLTVALSIIPSQQYKSE